MPQNFENMFSKYDQDGDGVLTLGELFSMIKGHRCAVDPFGVSYAGIQTRVFLAANIN